MRGLSAIPKAAIATLALGIGTSTAVITVAEAVLLRPLPVAQENRLAVLWGETPDGRFSNVPLTLDELQAFERQTRTLEQVAYHTFRGATATTFRVEDRVLQLRVALVSGNYFHVLGSRPAVGRALGVADDVKGVAPPLVLSYRVWQERFGGDSAVIGRAITLAASGQSYQVVGVMRPGLDYPRGTEVWAPLTSYSSAGNFYEYASTELDIVARLAEGVTQAQARSELTNFFRDLPPPSTGWRREARGVAHGFRDIALGDARPAMRVVLLAAVMLLVIASVNVANLQLARSLGRVRELVVRAALGASRARIVRHQITESLLLALTGGVAGIIVAAFAVKLFLAFAPPGLPRIDEIALNGKMFIAGVITAGITMIASGIAPALFALRVDAGDVLRSGARHSGGRRIRLIGELLAGTQVALAVVALSSAGLVGRSLVNLYRVDMAFDPGQLAVAELAIRLDKFPDRARQAELMTRLVARLEAIPGVRGVTPVLSVPFIGAGGGIDGRLSVPGQSAEERARNPIVNMEVISPSYFDVLDVPVLQGRAFTEEDREGAAHAVIVSSSTAQAFWPGRDAIGQRLAMGGEFTVVGVVPDTRYRDLKTARPSVYFPLAQPRFPMTPTTIVVRSDLGTRVSAGQLRQAVAEVEPDVVVSSVATLEELLDGPRAQPRLNAMTLSLFAAAALTLAAIGLFSVMSTMVRRRTRELGIRMALGATSGEVGRMVVWRGLAIAAGGVAVGVVGARKTSTMLSGLLFEVSATDGTTMVGIIALVLVVAILASLIPARVGAGVDPVKALRVD